MNEIHEYVRHTVQDGKTKRRRKVGVLVGFVDNEDVVHVGWSKLNEKSDDVFNKEEGLKIAREHGMKGTPVPVGRFHRKYDKFVTRCRKYFKNKIVGSNPIVNPV